METLVLTIHILIAGALVVVVLLQRSEGGGLGIGGGGLTGSAQDQSAEDVSGGGAIWRVALGYELGSSERGWSVTPNLAYEYLKPQMDSKVSLGTLSFNLEVAWELGRSES